MDEIESKAKSFFINLDYYVNKIPENNDEETCDLFVRNNSEKFLVEVKSKDSDKTIVKDLRKNNIATRKKSVGRTNIISNIVAKAYKQLNAIKDYGNCFKLIWFEIKHKETERLHFSQILSSLYGVEDIVFEPEKDNHQNKKCYYFTHSDFHKLPNLDGVIVSSPNGNILLVNNFSNQFNKFVTSNVSKIFTNRKRMFNPIDWEKENQCFIADCNTDRKNKEEILKYISQKYSLKNPINLVFNQYSVTQIISNNHE